MQLGLYPRPDCNPVHQRLRQNFIQAQPVEQAGQLNYIYPIALVDTFVENFPTILSIPAIRRLTTQLSVRMLPMS